MGRQSGRDSICVDSLVDFAVFTGIFALINYGSAISKLQFPPSLARLHYRRSIDPAYHWLVCDRAETVSAAAKCWSSMDQATIHDLGSDRNVLLVLTLHPQHTLGNQAHRLRVLSQVALCACDGVHRSLLGSLVEAFVLPDSCADCMVYRPWGSPCQMWTSTLQLYWRQFCYEISKHGCQRHHFHRYSQW